CQTVHDEHLKGNKGKQKKKKKLFYTEYCACILRLHWGVDCKCRTAENCQELAVMISSHRCQCVCVCVCVCVYVRVLCSDLRLLLFETHRSVSDPGTGNTPLLTTRDRKR